MATAPNEIPSDDDKKRTLLNIGHSTGQNFGKEFKADIYSNQLKNKKLSKNQPTKRDWLDG
jgi:hypothetical protein